MPETPRFVYLLYYDRGEDAYGARRHSLVGVFETLDLASAWAAAAEPSLADQPKQTRAHPVDAFSTSYDLGPPWTATRRRLNRPLPTDERYVTGSCLFGWVMLDEGEA
jgi:hypothetical protein